MRVMAIIMAAGNSPLGGPTDRQRLAELDRFNEELVRAGVMLAGEQLEPASGGVRVRFTIGAPPTIGETGQVTELVSGFWLWQVRSIDEAIEWAKRSPRPSGDTAEIEIRRVVELNG